ncbi:MAG: site-2 protease family protein [Candidatus Sericytochromatia bacterium]|nr:site-2 protease family protein [Candidatus Sericytochromatia bacterium]
MGESEGWRLGRVAGIPVTISPSWLVIVVAVALSLGVGVVPAWAPGLSRPAALGVGLLLTLLFFVGLVLHELAHARVSEHFGMPVARIRLFLFGGVSESRAEMRSPAIEFAVAIAGPLTSLALAAGALVAAWAVRAAEGPALLAAGLAWLALVNAGVAIFNLMPGFPMDGGRVLRAALWAFTGDLVRATRWASRVGHAFGWLLVAVGVVELATGGWVGGLWLMALGWLIGQAARGAYMQLVVSRALDQVPVAGLMATPPATLSPDLTLQDAVDHHFLPCSYHSYPVVSEGRLVGLIGRHQVRAVPRSRWPEVAVAEVMVARRDLPVVGPEMGVGEVLPLLMDGAEGRVPVEADGRLVGLLSQTDVLRYLTWTLDRTVRS